MEGEDAELDILVMECIDAVAMDIPVSALKEVQPEHGASGPGRQGPAAPPTLEGATGAAGRMHGGAPK